MAKILIVDDNPQIREVFTAYFEDSSDTVKTACDGKDALEKLKSFIPDLMLVDIMMPLMTGGEFIKSVGQAAVSDPRLRNIPFIVLTGENPTSSPDYEVLKKHANCKGFFKKGLPLASVANQIILVLSRSGKM